MKAKFTIKADCCADYDEEFTGEQLASYIKGYLRSAGIDAKVMIGFLRYDGETEVMKLERLRKGRAGNSK